MKTCTKCKNAKYVDDFRRDKSRKDELHPWCNLCRDKLHKDWVKINPDKIKAIRRKWNASNSKYFTEWQRENKDKVSVRCSKYKKANKYKVNALTAKRRANNLNATPTWLSEEQLKKIQIMYFQAANQDLTVDHIIPLQGENVCGLHVPWNLQLLSRSDNSKKGNR